MEYLYDALLGRWLWRLFRHGPALLGFWEGMGDADICARMSRTSEVMDWVNGSGDATAACVAMIRRRFGALEVVAQTALYAVTVYVAVTAAAQCVRAYLSPRPRVLRLGPCPVDAKIMDHI